MNPARLRRLVAPALLSPACLLAQETGAERPAREPVPLPLRTVVDAACAIPTLTSASDADPDLVRSALAELLGREAAGRGDYVWILRVPAAGSAPGDTLVERLFDARSGRRVKRDRLYEARSLRIVAILPPGAEPGSPGPPAGAVRVATEVRREESVLARGFPALAREILAALVARGAPPCPAPFRSHAVGVHATPIGAPDARILTLVEADLPAALGEGRRAELLRAFRSHRVEIEARWLGYTSLARVFDAVEAALAGPACAVDAATCLHAARAAAVAAVAELGLTAEHQIRAVREGTGEALAGLERELLARRHAALRSFRAVDRPWIGFSIGGILAEGSGEKLKFDVEDGRVTAEGIEGKGFKGLALVDLYFRPVDLGEDGPGLQPHASVGFTLGESFRPGAFLATTLPFTRGRLAVFGGGILRKETVSEVPVGTEVEPGSEPIRERYRFPLAVGLKVGLPL